MRENLSYQIYDPGVRYWLFLKSMRGEMDNCRDHLKTKNMVVMDTLRERVR